MAGRFIGLGMAALAFVISAGSCHTPIYEADIVEVQARAIVAACREVECEGSPIYVADSTDPAVIAEVVSLIGAEVVPLSDADELDLIGDDGKYADGGTMLRSGREVSYPGAVFGVDVFASRGRFEGIGKTYFFALSGDRWLEISPEDAGVTVTTSVP